MQKRITISIAFLMLLMATSISFAADVVNLNKANAAAIQQNLVGIGPIKAEAIIAYRKKNGKFKSIDDLLNVTGIGPALVKKNKRYLSLTKGVVSGDDKAYAAAKKQAGSAKKSSKKSTTKKSTTAAKTSKSKTSSKTSKSAEKSKDKSTKKSTSKTKKKKDSSSKTKKKKTKKKASPAS